MKARIAVVSLLLTSCAMSSAREPEVRFEIRGFATRADESEYATTFSAGGTVIALGDSVVAKKPYIVLVEFKYLSGGDPELTHEPMTTRIATVRNGTGEIWVQAGYRQKRTSYQAAETWPPKKYEVRIVGYAPLYETSSTTVSN